MNTPLTPSWHTPKTWCNFPYIRVFYYIIPNLHFASIFFKKLKFFFLTNTPGTWIIGHGRLFIFWVFAHPDDPYSGPPDYLILSFWAPVAPGQSSVSASVSPGRYTILSRQYFCSVHCVSGRVSNHVYHKCPSLFPIVTC